MTRLAAILDERHLTYTAVADEARLQPRTVRQLATGETPIDNVSVGTIRRIAQALSLPVSVLLEPGAPHPGDPTLPRGERLRLAISDVMWAGARTTYVSPVEGEADDVIDRSVDEFFADMPPIDARRG